jgi:hypothetical protein
MAPFSPTAGGGAGMPDLAGGGAGGRIWPMVVQGGGCAPPAADLHRGHVPARREPGGSGPERPQRAAALGWAW